MRQNLFPIPRRNREGFTLVEVMVAMVIGMIGIIIMMQVFSVAEGQKRTTTGTGDAQSNGAMALYTLQRDIRQAGYGFNALNTLGCPLALPAPVSHTLAQLAPAIINPPAADLPSGDIDTDTLLITYGSSEGSPEGDAITALNGQDLGVMTPTNFRVGHRVVAAPAAPTNGCSLTLATVSGVSAPNVTVESSGAEEGGTLFNFGSAPRILAYAVRSGNLTVCDYTTVNCATACTAGHATCNDNWIPVANNVVSLRAQYGRDTAGVIAWDQTTPPLPPASQSALACSWAGISALRIAVVARNSQVDKDAVSGPSAPQWAGSADTPIDLSDRGNWQNYRYKIFETVVPLRNLPWMTSCT